MGGVGREVDGRSGERRWMGGVGRGGGWEEWGGEVDGRSGEGSIASGYVHSLSKCCRECSVGEWW